MSATNSLKITHKKTFVQALSHEGTNCNNNLAKFKAMVYVSCGEGNFPLCSNNLGHTKQCKQINLINVFVASPREAAHIVAAENVQRRVIHAGARRKQHRHQQLRVNYINSLAARCYPLCRIQQIKCGGVCPLTYGLHERCATFRIPKTNPHYAKSASECKSCKHMKNASTC